MRSFVTIATLLLVAACHEHVTEAENASPTEKRPGGNTQVFQIVNMPSTEWNINADTSACGSLVLRWNQQPKPSWVKYVILPTPLFQTTSLCAGGLNSSTNVLYYQYGWGCSFAPSQMYAVKVTYSVVDSAQKKTFVYTSLSDTIHTGRGSWNCN